MAHDKKIDSYPWAVPTKEQRRMFDALSYDEQLEMLRAALIEAENSGDAGPLDMDDIRRKTKKRPSSRYAPGDARRAGSALFKAVMDQASVHGAHATPKGLRHGFGVRAAEKTRNPRLVQK